ncbi:MAG TPA: cupin-like domain-containing protein [Blastocatellia bacterium]|nr:cupin-like domain-containing protein [Blastocatellia bacterium]
MTGPTYFQIERVEQPSPEEFLQRYEIPMKPVVITGALSRWKALSIWNHEWFKQEYGPKVIGLSVNPTHTYRVLKMKLADYIDRIQSGTDKLLYMDQCPIEEFPGLSDYFQAPEYCNSERELIVNLWVGPAGTILGFHKDNHNQFDAINNIFVQIHGRKRIVLAAPDQDAFMYQRAPENGAYWHSQIYDPDEVDFSLHPLFRQATLFETIIHPGEILFIPGNYWHYVRALDKSISMSFWWRHYRLVEIINGFFKNASSEKERSTFLESYGGVITPKDVEDFGGIEKLANALNGLGERRHSVLDLFAASVRVTLPNTSSADAPSGR